MNEAARDQVAEIPGEFDLTPYIAGLKAQWRIVAYAIVLGLVCASLYLHIAPREYTTQLQVVPVDQGNGSGGSGGHSQLADLASLVGFGTPSASQSNFDLYLEGLTSRIGAERLATDQELLKRLYAPEWDQDRKIWHDPSPLRRGFFNVIRAVIGLPMHPWSPPDGARLQEYLGQNIKVERDKEKPIVTVVYQGRDPLLGRDLLWRLHKSVDDLLRQRALARTTSSIEYLTNKLNTITVADYREAIIGTLSGQEKSRMAASSYLPYVAEPFGQPTSSQQPTSPKFAVVFLIAIILSLLVGGTAALWIERRRLR